MKFSRNVTQKDFYKIYLKTLSGLVGLTPTEMSIVEAFMTMRNTLMNTEGIKNVPNFLFAAECRKEIAEQLDMSIWNLNNYIKSIKAKKIFIKNDYNQIDISPMIFIPIPTDEFSIEFNFKINEGSEN